MYDRVKYPRLAGVLVLSNSILPNQRHHPGRSGFEVGFEGIRGPTVPTNHQLSTLDVDPTGRDHLHDDPRVEFWVRSDLIPVLIHRLLNVKRGDHTSDCCEKHPDRKMFPRASTTKGAENAHISNGGRR